MKTKEQILEWLDKQTWANEFHKAVFTLRTDLNLNYNNKFISSAFKWKLTEQGVEVWRQRDTEFRKWYNANDKPMSWEEYCEQNPIKEGAYYIDEICCISEAATSVTECRDVDADANVMSKALCEAFLAYMKLIQLRNVWVKNCDADDCLIKIEAKNNGIFKDSYLQFMNGLSFPTHEMAKEFISTFFDLLEIAKPLL